MMDWRNSQEEVELCLNNSNELIKEKSSQSELLIWLDESDWVSFKQALYDILVNFFPSCFSILSLIT